jgi:hypothetical protein
VAPVPNSDASHCGTNAWQKSSTSQKNLDDPASSPPSLSDGRLPQKASHLQPVNRAKTPYPGILTT